MYRGLIGDIMVINNQADVEEIEEIEGIEFINRIPLHMQQIMANISRMSKLNCSIMKLLFKQLCKGKSLPG